MSEGRPVMMKLPHKITFYTQNRVYEGFGSVSRPAVLIGVTLTLIGAGVMSYGLMKATRKTNPLPGTFSKEKKDAEAAKSQARRADPIQSHTIGQKV